MSQSEEMPPLQALYKGMQKVMLALPSLDVGLSIRVKSIALLDPLPRHDVVLDNAMLRRVYNFPSIYPFHSAAAELSRSLQAIDVAVEKLTNACRGEAKTRYFDRLVAHRAQAAKLLQTFQEVPRTLPDRPYLIRQEMMGELYYEFSEVLDAVSPLRKAMEGKVLPEDFYAQLDSFEDLLFECRANVARWRDNPSQKLGAKLAAVASAIEAARRDMERLKQNTQFECQQIGIKFYNRAGRSIVERC